MRRTMTWLSFLVLLSIAFAGTVVYGGDAVVQKAAAPKKKEAPIMAGFGMMVPKHSCTETYGECMQGCGKTGGANCDLECVSDCNVCALDFGEEALAVCRQ